jgi:hypothetical protein
MPLLRCTNRDCGHQWFERSQLAVGSDCPVCDEPTEVVGVDDEPPAELNIVSSQLRGERAHLGHAREKAREVLREHRIGHPPVVVHSIARKCGFEVRNSHQLGKHGVASSNLAVGSTFSTATSPQSDTLFVQGCPLLSFRRGRRIVSTGVKNGALPSDRAPLESRHGKAEVPGSIPGVGFAVPSNSRSAPSRSPRQTLGFRAKRQRCNSTLTDARSFDRCWHLRAMRRIPPVWRGRLVSHGAQGA